MLLPVVTPERARRNASATGSARILVIGDAMLDIIELLGTAGGDNSHGVAPR